MDDGVAIMVIWGIAITIVLATWVYSNLHNHDDDDTTEIEVHHDNQ